MFMAIYHNRYPTQLCDYTRYSDALAELVKPVRRRRSNRRRRRTGPTLCIFGARGSANVRYIS